MKRFFYIAAIWVAGIGAVRAQNIVTNYETGIILLPVKDEATHEMIRSALKESDSLTRVQALATLAVIGDPADISLIKGLLNDPVPAVREEAAQCLKIKMSGAATQEIPASLTLARSIEESASPLAIQAGLTNFNVMVQEASVDAVMRNHLAELATELVPLLKSPDSVLRRHICQALGKIGNDQSAALAGQLARDEDPFVQRAAAEALLMLHSDADREALLALVKNPRASVRMESAMALGKWGQPAVALALHELLPDHDVTVVAATAEALGRLGNPESKQPLIAAFQKDGTMAGERMAWALGELHAAEAVPVLEAGLNKAFEATQASSAEALGKIGDPQAIPALQKVLVEMSAHGPLTRQRSIEALQRLGDRGSLKRIMQIITERVVPPPPGLSVWQYDMDDTRAAGIRYLGFLGDPQLADEMLGRLKEMPPYGVRKVMAEVISRLTGKSCMAAYSKTCRHYWMESLGEEDFGPQPTGTGIIPIPD